MINRAIIARVVTGMIVLAGTVFSIAHAPLAQAATAAASTSTATSTGGGALLAAGSNGTSTVSASSAATSTVSAPPIPVDDCAPTVSDIDQLAAIQSDPSLSASAEISQELSLRKKLIGRTIACAQNELKALRTSLSQASATTEAAKNIQAQLAGKLSDAGNFYSLELGKLSDAGLAGSKSIASEVLAWRGSNYLPLAGQVNNFALWAKNQNLFIIAQNRMNQTQQAVSFLESAAGNADLQDAFNAAYASFQSAKSDNLAAQSALAQSLPPSQALALIKKSLDELSSTYQQFFQVSDIIKKLLPQ